MATPSNNSQNSRRTFLKQLSLLVGGIAVEVNIPDLPTTSAMVEPVPEIPEATYEAAKLFLKQLQSARNSIQLNDHMLKLYNSPFWSSTPTIDEYTHLFWEHTQAVDEGIKEFERLRSQIKRAFPNGIVKQDIESFLQELKEALEDDIHKYMGGKTEQKTADAVLKRVTELRNRNMDEINQILGMPDEEFKAFAAQKHEEAIILDKQYKDFFDKIQKTNEVKQTRPEKYLFDERTQISRNVHKDKQTGDIIYRITLPRLSEENRYKTFESKTALGIRTTALKKHLEHLYPDIKVESTDPTRGLIFVHTPPQSRAQKLLEQCLSMSSNMTIGA